MPSAAHTLNLKNPTARLKLSWLENASRGRRVGPRRASARKVSTLSHAVGWVGGRTSAPPGPQIRRGFLFSSCSVSYRRICSRCTRFRWFVGCNSVPLRTGRAAHAAYPVNIDCRPAQAAWPLDRVEHHPRRHCHVHLLLPSQSGVAALEFLVLDQKVNEQVGIARLDVLLRMGHARCRPSSSLRFSSG